MEERAVVSLVKCESYSEEEVYRSIQTAVALLGGWQLFFQIGEKILLKPNLLRKATPEEAITTHPAVMKAVALLLREAGFDQLSYGDSPANHSMEVASRAAGLTKVAEEIGLPAADFHQSRTVEFEGLRFAICNGALDADAILNLPKMKTHALERITGAVKNTYGCIHGIQKAAGHTQFPDARSLAGMLSKLERALKPRLHIMDAVVAMEGNGPASGDPVKMNLILASANPYALDEVFCRLIALNPAMAPTNAYNPAREVLIRTSQGEISWKDAVQLYGKKDFRVDRGIKTNTGSKALRRVSGILQKRPVIRRDLCKSCMACIEICPLSGKALKMQGKFPVYDYDACIRCFCCQEMCPHQAIVPRQSLPGKILAGKWRH
ncbi:MAG: DUF362 domain-containing protein [Clostridiales bacterium]|nr:DUF362 domain-containing protein [Clostridiales bacterium]